MEQPLKQRLIGAAVLAALAVIFLPMLLKGPDVREPDAAEVPLTMPATPGQDFETRELPLTMPEPTPAGGAVGMPSRVPAPDADTVAGDPPTVDVPPGDAAAPGAAAPAPAAPASAPESAATGGGDFVVNIGSFGDLANASALVARLRGAGLPVLVDAVRIDGAEGRRIRVGPYTDRTAAEAARLRARSAANASGTVVALDGKPLPPAATLPAPAPAVATAPAKPLAPAPTPAAPTAAVAAPTTPAPAPATAGAGFAVQLSAPSVEADAIALRDKARAQGFSSFVQRIEVDGGTRFRVRIGPYADRADAESARDSANGKLGTKGIVMRHP
jgi:DedD protein